MQIFYAPLITGDTYVLDETESKHCIKVLRMVKGEKVNLIDGKGNLFEGYVTNPDTRKCGISITQEIRGFENRDYNLHIAISPLKNPERFELFVEKSVEFGIDEITPLICNHTERKNIKTERVEKVIISAMKQSLKALKTKLNEPILFTDFVKKEYNAKKLIAHCNDLQDKKSISEVYSRRENVLIMIGPEGDFSEDEINLSKDKGFIPIHLGTSRLRTETAGIAACHSIYFINQ